MSKEITELDPAALEAALIACNAQHRGQLFCAEIEVAILAYLNAIRESKDVARQYISDN